MAKETYQIYDFVPDILMSFLSVFSVKGEITLNDDEMSSTDRLKLESYNPKDTILVATFLHDQYSTKKAYFYVASFKEAHSRAKHDQAFSLFSIRWDEEESHWEKVPEYCCFVQSEQPQPPLHKEAANWMLKRMTTKGSGFPDVDYFIKGKFELLI